MPRERVKMPKSASPRGMLGTNTPITLAMLLAPRLNAPKAPTIINPVLI